MTLDLNARELQIVLDALDNTMEGYCDGDGPDGPDAPSLDELAVLYERVRAAALPDPDDPVYTEEECREHGVGTDPPPAGAGG
jgi:hypothetical protein